MITRLRVRGFKNLYDVDVRLGPLTCIAGENAVGKSNLFDAIGFLSRLADKPLVEAAMGGRGEIFHRAGDRCADAIHFDVEMIVPKEGVDDLGQPVKASATLLSYGLSIGSRAASGKTPAGLEILREELTHLTKGSAARHLTFPHSAVQWRNSVVTADGHRTVPYLSTERRGKSREIQLHPDGRRGRIRQINASTLPRTVLSKAGEAEGPTMTLARREMQSWKLLHMEPASLGSPSAFTAPAAIGPDGSNLAARLFHLARLGSTPEQVYSKVAKTLSGLIDDVGTVWVDNDEQREVRTLWLSGSDGTPLPARALSAGTLRFLALAVLAQDSFDTGVLCMEEPENGIHPSRLAAMTQLLRQLAVDPDEPVGSTNPMRQVLVNTHSPLIVQGMDTGDVLYAYKSPRTERGQHFQVLELGAPEDSWRLKAGGFRPAPAKVALQFPIPQRSSGRASQLSMFDDLK